MDCSIAKILTLRCYLCDVQRIFDQTYFLHLIYQLLVGSCRFKVNFYYNAHQRHIQNPAEHLRCSFFAKIVNGFQLLTIFAKSSAIMSNWVLNTPLNNSVYCLKLSAELQLILAKILLCNFCFPLCFDWLYDTLRFFYHLALSHYHSN